MILERVTIEDFKSIKKLNFLMHDLTCVVGKNESGKSAILEAISFLNFTKYKLDENHVNKNSVKYDNDEYPIITGYFLLDDIENKEISEMLPLQFDPKNKAIPKAAFQGKWLRVIISGNKEADLNIDLVAGNNRSFRLTENYTPQEIGKIKITLVKDFIPNIELFTNDSLVLTPITIEQIKQKQGSFETFKRLFALGGIRNPATLNIARIEKLDDKLFVVSEKITALLQKNYSQDKSIEVRVKYSGNKFILKFIDSSKRSYTLSERSLGFRYFFSFLINTTYLNLIEKKDNIYLLDEPGNSLHPEGARDLIKIFEEIAEKEQLVYTTHNPFLAYKRKPDNLVLAKKNSSKGTEILTKVYTNKYQVLRKELGLLLNDSFLVNDINIVVEGNADKYILHYIIHEDDYFEPLTWTHIYSADSATEVIPSVRYLNNLDLKGVVLLDADKAGANEIKKPKFKTHIIDKANWNYLTLNFKLNDKKERTIEDMVLQEAYLDAYNKYYLEQEETLEWDKPFEAIDIKKYNSPILDTINPHFKTYLSGGINKIAIFRKFIELNPYDENIGSYHDLMELIMEIQDRVMDLK
ncbi:ATP-dependent nuclease [Patiriisocius marinus]|uniref:ATP-dependent nuclease n=1 Tax=Patiriisocius marinus TaxID=1397112 RepID=UPI00232FD5B5|nr:ATP-binding protein [Patiriisocius marinus]